ncbi:hypothetical protein EN873_04485 [bacterium M00.F.Ca.ET.230.01.1.1]|nr:hypothetical protein EN873_04485 [bacterium M00.F.Ca.ET.230.01.1.1]
MFHIHKRLRFRVAPAIIAPIDRLEQLCRALVRLFGSCKEATSASNKAARRPPAKPQRQLGQDIEPLCRFSDC